VQKKLKAFVLGAGLGTRLKPLTDSVPKPLLPVGGRPLIERVFDSLLAAGVGEFIVNTHHMSAKYFERYPDSSYRGAKITFEQEKELLDTGGGVKNILKYLDFEEPLIVYNGDIYFDAPLSKFISPALKDADAATLCLRDSGTNMNIAVFEDRVVDLRFKRGAPFARLAQFAGIFMAHRLFLEACAAYEGDVFSTVDVFLKLLEEDPKCLGARFLNDGVWSDIGTHVEYDKLNESLA